MIQSHKNYAYPKKVDLFKTSVIDFAKNSRSKTA